MRGIRTAGLGLAVAFTPPLALAQDAGRGTATLPAPAARLGVIRAVGGPDASPSVLPAGVVARGQTATLPQSMPPGTIPSLGMPRSVGAPAVTEIRGASPPAAAFGTPTAIGQPVIVGVGQPVPTNGSPLVSGPAGTGVPVPSVMPFDAMPGTCPPTTMEAPLYGGHPRFGGPYGLLAGGPVLQRLQVNADYLLWWTKSFNTPTLLTTSSPAFNGILGTGDTRPLLANRSINPDLQQGGRFGATYWMGAQQIWGLDGDVFFLGTNGGSTTISSLTNPVLARPFFNVNTNSQFSELVAFPGLANGAATVTNETQFWGAQANLRRKLLVCDPCNKFDLFTGFRFARLTDGLNVTENFSRVPGTPIDPSISTVMSGTVTDDIRTSNEFYGWNFGAVAEARRGRWFGNVRGSVALGDNFQTVQINGSQVLQTTTGTTMAAGGLLAIPGANIGTFTQSKFAVLPEVGVQLGYYLTPHWRIGVGYNFMYLSSVVRPGDQIDTGLDVTRIPNFPVNPMPAPLGFTRPLPTMKTTDFWAQGVSFSLQWVW